MARHQIGNIHGVAAKNITNGVEITNTTGDADGDVMTAYKDADQLDIGAMRTRLAAINGTYYTAAVLEGMTMNDMAYAIRLNDHAGTI